MYKNYITEPDFFRHEKPERLVCDRIEIEGYQNQRTVLNVPVRLLRPFKLYELVIRQPIPSDARGLPLYLKCIADTDFFPNVSVGFGRKDECHKEFRIDGIEHFENDGIRVDGDECVEVVTERIEAKMFQTVMYGYGNIAFGNDLVFRNEEPYPFIRMYLNDDNKFVILPYCKSYEGKPKKLIKKTEIIVREPIHAETLGIGRSFTEFVHPSKRETFETWTEGSCGCRSKRIW